MKENIDDEINKVQAVNEAVQKIIEGKLTDEEYTKLERQINEKKYKE